MPKDNQDKRFVIEFFRRKRVEAREIPQSSGRRTPDFELYIGNDLFAYCELKSIMPCESLFSNMPIGQVREVLIQGNAPVKDIKKDIHKACNQLRSMNPDHEVPNIVFFINHNRLRNVGDLQDVIGVKLSNVPGFFCPLYRNKLLGKGDLEVADCVIFVEFLGQKVDDKNDCGEATVLDDYAKDFLKYAGKDEKWAKEAICKKSFPHKAYYFLSTKSHLQDCLKEKISSKRCEILTIPA